MDVKEQVKVTWRIKDFSSVQDKRFYSEKFIVDGIKWQIHIFPERLSQDYLVVYLVAVDYKTLPSDGSSFAQLGLAVIHQNDRRKSITNVCKKYFKVLEPVADTASTLLPLCPDRGYLVDDACVVEAYFSSDRTRDLISEELIFESDWDGHMLESYDSVMSEDEEITASSSTRPSSLDIKYEELAAKEEMKAFFTRMETEFLRRSNIVCSREEAREAVAELDEALSMTPNDFYDLGKFSPLKKAFKILAGFDCSSTGTSSTIEQKNELLDMEGRLKTVADRAAKELKDKNLLIMKESKKLTISRYIERNLIRFKKVESEVEQVEKKLAALHKQVEETQRKRKNLLADQKRIFRSSEQMKWRLEIMGKQWVEYEINSHIAEERGKIVEDEWERMKDFVSSIKGKI